MVMLATPIAMVACNYPVSDAAVVIQWHVLGMFIPSFFSGRLVDRFGAATEASWARQPLEPVRRSRQVASSFSISVSLWPYSASVGIFMYVAGTTLITAAHRPEERGRVQGTAEMLIAGIATLSSFASAGLLNGLGWSAVNIGAAPVLITTALLTIWFARRSAKSTPAQA